MSRSFSIGLDGLEEGANGDDHGRLIVINGAEFVTHDRTEFFACVKSATPKAG
jgi:hypothetical protein